MFFSKKTFEYLMCCLNVVYKPLIGIAVSQMAGSTKMELVEWNLHHFWLLTDLCTNIIILPKAVLFRNNSEIIDMLKWLETCL